MAVDAIVRAARVRAGLAETRPVRSTGIGKGRQHGQTNPRTPKEAMLRRAFGNLFDRLRDDCERLGIQPAEMQAAINAARSARRRRLATPGDADAQQPDAGIPPPMPDPRRLRPAVDQ